MKRKPWLKAHGVIEPPAAEYNIKQPVMANSITIKMKTKFRFKKRSFMLKS